jgi:hypothetical protein
MRLRSVPRPHCSCVLALDRPGVAARSEKGHRGGCSFLPPGVRLSLCRAGLIDGCARPLLLSFDLRRAPQGAGLVAAGGETSHSPLSSGAPRRIRAFLPPRVAKRALRQRQLGAEARRGGSNSRRPAERFPAMPGRSGRSAVTRPLPSRSFGHGRDGGGSRRPQLPSVAGRPRHWNALSSSLIS